MKKIQSKKLNLNKLTVSVLTNAELQKAQGGQLAYTKASVCMEQCCQTDYCSSWM